MLSEEELLPLSALENLVFCERQAALVQTERLRGENRFTIEGEHLHQTVDTAPGESRPGVYLARALPLRSFRLGVAGRADLVELYPAAAGEPGAVPVPGHEGRFRLYPVEHKRGKPRSPQKDGSHLADAVQLCAQALCLEEMLGATIPEGAIFYWQIRRRQPVAFGDDLRALTAACALRLAELLASGRTPAPRYGPKCRSCSLLELCQPRAPERSAARYLERQLAAGREEPA